MSSAKSSAFFSPFLPLSVPNPRNSPPSSLPLRADVIYTGPLLVYSNNAFTLLEPDQRTSAFPISTSDSYMKLFTDINPCRPCKKSSSPLIHSLCSKMLHFIQSNSLRKATVHYPLCRGTLEVESWRGRVRGLRKS